MTEMSPDEAAAPNFEGHDGRECGEHRTTGGRAWCYDCGEWCYPSIPCARCELPALRAEVENAHREYCERLATISGECTERNGRIAALQDELHEARAREAAVRALADELEQEAAEETRALNRGRLTANETVEAYNTVRLLSEDVVPRLRAALGSVETPHEDNRG